ncbi:MAG: hypothetical protein OXB89_06355 [Anaerolineaceae bacterium]|nr:hypothetical protein [Anaerolineaceae bacterium]
MLVVEGQDDRRFFEALLKHCGISDFQVLQFAGVSNLSSRLDALRIVEGFATVTTLGVVRDANGNRNAAFQSVQDALRAARLPVPSRPLVLAGNQPRVSVMILPPEEIAGGMMLEDLCLKAVENDPAMRCVDDYFRCLEKQNVSLRESAIPKARLHAFLASRERPGLRLGEAAEKNDIPLDSPVFEPVVNFLRQLSAG